jgi:hypothetical protein
MHAVMLITMTRVRIVQAVYVIRQGVKQAVQARILIAVLTGIAQTVTAMMIVATAIIMTISAQALNVL